MRRIRRETVVDSCNGKDTWGIIRRSRVEEVRERSEDRRRGLKWIAESTTVYVAFAISSESLLRGQGICCTSAKVGKMKQHRQGNASRGY